MQRSTGKCLVTVFITLMMVITVTQPIVSFVGSDGQSDDVLDAYLPEYMPGQSGKPDQGEPSNAEKGIYDFASSISPKSKPGKLEKVVIATTNIGSVATLLKDYRYKGWIGTQSTNTRGIAFPILEVPAAALNELERLPCVLGIYDYKEPTPTSNTDQMISLLKEYSEHETMDQSENVNSDTLYHGAEDAWVNGFTGQGVNVATITAGCDFGHYELAGRQAMVDDDFIFSVTNEVVVATTDTVVDNKTRLPIPDYYLVDNGNALVYLNSNLMTSGYILYANGTLLFTDPIAAGSEVTATYTYWSPYLNYPIAFDPTSMTEYLTEGPRNGLITPSDSWYVNTSSTDLHVYHTIEMDGVNDFWEETNTHGSSDSTYPLSMTSELRSSDGLGDMKAKELDLTSLFVTSDSEYWYIGFDVTPEVVGDGEWHREFDVKYGLYIDTVANSGGDIDPLNNYVNTTPANEPEFALYIHHTSVNWGVRGSSVNWGVNDEGLWSKNLTIVNASDANVWSKNNTVSNASFYSWDDGSSSWSDFIITEDQPFNETVGIGPTAGSSMFESQGKRYLQHEGDIFEILGNGSVANYIWYNQSGYGVVHLSMVKGQQEFTGEFIEISIPKKMLPNVDDMSLILFTTGKGKSQPQDSCPPDVNVWNDTAHLEATEIVTLSNFTFVNTPPMYIVDGITSQSGNYHIGLHPDQNLITKHFGRPVAVLLTDPYEDGVYDTVYVDLDNDKNFSDEHPVQALSAHNETLGLVPSNGTVRLENSTIIHGGSYYSLYNERIDEEVIEEADGLETLLRLEHRNIIDAPILQWNIKSGNKVKFLNKTDNYTIDSINGTIELFEALEHEDVIIALNYTYKAEAYEQYALIDFMGARRKMELRSWIASKDLDTDGGEGDEMEYPDLSGGMVYFIGDGITPLPYSDIITDRSGVIESNRIPGNGELIAFFGEFDADSVQGTEVASMISGVGAGIDGNSVRLIRGMAPNAKLIPARGGNPFQAWYYAVEGYDGVIGSPDDAQIVAVTNNYPVDTAGWDIYTKAANYIGAYYSEGRTCFVAGTGATGYGYGTAGSPSSGQAVITAGIGTQFDYRNYNPGAPVLLNRRYADSGPNPMHGDVLPSSSRGPNMLGEPVPDVITAGAFLFGSTPLNMDQDATTPSEFDYYGGQWAWDLWTGAALSSASTAGIMALIYDAFYQANGRFPDIAEAKSLIRSGADNLNYDILTQGAGWTNADRSTQLANGMDGLYLDKTYWVPGDYRGVKYEGFVKLMEQGESETQTFTISNKNPSTASEVKIDDAVFKKMGNYSLTINVSKTYDDKEIPGVVNIEPYIPIGTELLIMTATAARRPEMGNYMAELFDWTDIDEDGQLEFPDEQNRMCYAIGPNHLELRYRDPLGRVDDGLAVQIKDFGGADTNIWTINLDFYNKTDWDWLDYTGSVPTSVPAGGSASFNARITVPDNASLGSYEGSIYVKEKEPEETIATGVGLVMNNVPFKLWFNPTHGAEGTVNDNVTTAGARQIVPRSTVIEWNGTFLYEGVDYELSGTGGAVKFAKQFPAGNAIPAYVPWFNMTYLTVDAVDGVPVEEATWSGTTNEPNFVRGDNTIIVRKNGVPWSQTEVITGETVLTSTGGELAAALANRNIVRETIEVYKDAVVWDQLVVPPAETFTTVPGQNTSALPHGNTVPGTIDIYVNGSLLPQTGEVKVLNKEEIQGLNSTSIQVTGQSLTVGGVPETGGSMWGSGTTWWGKVAVNANDTPEFTILSYMLYEDGTPLVDGDEVYMHTNDTHGHFTLDLDHDSTGHVYTINYKYYDNTLKFGNVSNGNIISESYTVYRNGQSLTASAYQLDLKSGKIIMTNELGPDEIIEIAYKYNIYALNTRTGEISFSDSFIGGETVEITYQYYTYTLDLATGILYFADPLNAGEVITADYEWARYLYDYPNGEIRFANPLFPGDVVTCEYWHYSAMIPVFINIGASKPDFTFGGDEDCDDLFNYNEITGGYGGGAGDWRFFYMDIQEQGVYTDPSENHRLLVDVAWEFNYTDVDVQVYGGHNVLPEVVGNALPPDVYGPHSISHVGGSDVTPDFLTTTGGPEEIVAPRISGGLNVVALHTVGMNGTSAYTEKFNGRVGTLYVAPTEIEIVSNKLYGEKEIEMVSNMEWQGVGGIAAGPSSPESLKNLTVGTDDPDWSNYDSFEQQLASGTTVYSRTIKDCLIFHVHIWGHTDFGYKDVVDLDLGVFLDGSGEEVEEPDGIVQEDEFVAYGADFDADEEVKLIAPPDGTYLIVVYGFTILTDPAHFDMDITIVQGAGFDLTGKGVNSLPAEQVGYFSSNQTERPWNMTYLNLEWDLPGSSTGSLQGALYIGPGNGPMAMLIPIELVIDMDPPVIKDEVRPADGSVTSKNRPLISGSIEDTEREEIDRDSVKLHLDGMDVTSIASISVEEADNTAGSGYPQGSATYQPTAPLAEGGHIVELRAKDWAGNEVVKSWGFTVDTKKPILDLTSLDSTTYTNYDSVTIQGKSEVDSDVVIMIGAVSAEVKRDAVGGFTADVDLTEDNNLLMVTSSDSAGNSNLQVFTIIRDNEVPEFERLVGLDGTLTREANTIISGSVNEVGTMTVNGDPASVNSDGTFDKNVELTEGENVFALEFTDLAGNMAYDWLNITLDTLPPVIDIQGFEASVTTNSINITGITETGAFVSVNGKLVQVEATRQATGSFTKVVQLSPGANTLVVEARDPAGNSDTVYLTVVRAEETGTNWAAIGLMIVLLVVGLFVGLLLAMMLFGTREREIHVVEEDLEEAPEEDMEEPADIDEDEDLGEPSEMDEDLEEAEIPEDAEDIPEEEGMPEDLPEDEYAEPEEVEVEPEMDEAEAEEMADEIVAEETAGEAMEEAPDEVPEAPVEDEKVLKLKQAYEEGKISKELYEKNLKKLQG